MPLTTGRTLEDTDPLASIEIDSQRVAQSAVLHGELLKGFLPSPGTIYIGSGSSELGLVEARQSNHRCYRALDHRSVLKLRG